MPPAASPAGATGCDHALRSAARRGRAGARCGGKFTSAIRQLPAVLECFFVTGDFDYLIKVLERDLKSLSQFLMDTLMALPGVSHVRSSVCLDEVKNTGSLPLPG